MISVEEARARIIAGLTPTNPEIVPLAAAYGRVLAQNATARLTQPPADLSAMDGYAVRAADATPGAILSQIGHAPAGAPWQGQLQAGTCVRLFTGSFVPEGADAVLLQEDASASGDQITVREAARPGQHIRKAGQDFSAGELLLKAGQRLTARDIGLAAAANLPWLTVHRRPRMAILATGDEIALPGHPIPPGGIISSNSLMLAALVTQHGGEPLVTPIARDNIAELAAAAAACQGADLLLTTGGASVGDHDLLQPALLSAGFMLDFWKIAMRPGKPMMFGRLGALPVLGLPGNPVSAYVCALLFATPALARLAGLTATDPPTQTAILTAPLPPNPHPADPLRATPPTTAPTTCAPPSPPPSPARPR